MSTTITSTMLPSSKYALAIDASCTNSCTLSKFLNPSSISSRSSYMFAGVGINSHLDKLREGYGIKSHIDGVDLRYLAERQYKRIDLENAGIETLARVVLEKEIMEKPGTVTRSRWDQRSLNEDQVMYACVDAFLCFKIGKLLLYAYTSDSD